MNLSTKIGIGLGTLISVCSLSHADSEVIKEKPLETLAACAVIIGITTSAAKIGQYISDNTIIRYASYSKSKYQNKNDSRT